MGAEHADFSGYATKVGLKCSDGRTIMRCVRAPGQEDRPLVWQHAHDDPKNVLGHAVLEEREDGVYAHAYFNDTPRPSTPRRWSSTETSSRSRSTRTG